MNPRRRNNKGAALIEFSLVAMLLIALSLGVIEFGLLIKDYITLSQASREGVRFAALGQPVSAVEDTVRSSALTLDTSKLQINCFYRTFDAIEGWPSQWVSGTPTEMPNENIQVKVQTTYEKQMITQFFGIEPINLKSEMVMRRE